MWNNWLLLAFLAPAFWALVNVIDAYFVGEVYEDEYDGTIISGIFQIAAWAVLPWFEFPSADLTTFMLGLLGGFLFSTSMYFYFKAIFMSNDVALIQILWNTIGIAVPILSFVLLRERLSVAQYGGIVITFIGANIFSFHGGALKGKFVQIGKTMMVAVLLLSLSMVVEDRVYQKTSFVIGLMFFTLGSFIAGVTFHLIKTRIKKKQSNLNQLSKKYFWVFLLAETLALLGVIFSQRTIDLSPSVSFVAVIESLQPAFVMLFSGVIFAIFTFLFANERRKKIANNIFSDQFSGWETKTIAVAVMAVGIYMINL